MFSPNHCSSMQAMFFGLFFLFCRCSFKNLCFNSKWWIKCFYQFFLSATFLYPLKTSENLIVFWCFQGVEKGCIGNKWVKLSVYIQILYFCNSSFLNSFVCELKLFFTIWIKLLQQQTQYFQLIDFDDLSQSPARHIFNFTPQWTYASTVSSGEFINESL